MKGCFGCQEQTLPQNRPQDIAERSYARARAYHQTWRMKNASKFEEPAVAHRSTAGFLITPKGKQEHCVTISEGERIYLPGIFTLGTNFCI